MSGPNNLSSTDRDATPPEGDGGWLAGLWFFLRHNKKWWLTPIILLLLLMAALVIFGGSGNAPFIYTIF